jgi:hypothetical protein
MLFWPYSACSGYIPLQGNHLEGDVYSPSMAEERLIKGNPGSANDWVRQQLTSRAVVNAMGS